MVSLMLIIPLYVVLLFYMTEVDSNKHTALDSPNIFIGDFFNAIGMFDEELGVVISPHAMQSFLALVFIGAKEDTADELRKGLKLGDGDKTTIAKNYGKILKSGLKNPMFKMATRMFVPINEKVKSKFNNFAEKYFGVEVKNIYFGHSLATTGEINNWFEKKTNNVIRHMLLDDDIKIDTSVVFVNAVTFKAKWPYNPKWWIETHEFPCTGKSIEYIRAYDYYIPYTEVDIEGTIHDVIEISLKQNLSILIIKQRYKYYGLSSKAKRYDWLAVRKNLKKTKTDLLIPTFEGLFDINFFRTLPPLGIQDMFSSDANLSDLFAKPGNQHISLIKHQVYVNLTHNNMKRMVRTGNSFKKKAKLRYFNPPINKTNDPPAIGFFDRAFTFLIVSKEDILLLGHIQCLPIPTYEETSMHNEFNNK